MLSLILPVISLPYQLNHHIIMHEVAVLDKKQGFLLCQVVANLPNIGPDRTVMLPEVVNLAHNCMFTRRRHLTQKQYKESYNMYSD